MTEACADFVHQLRDCPEQHGGVSNVEITHVTSTGNSTGILDPRDPADLNPNLVFKAAVIEGPGGPYYIKVVGPAKTIAKWDASVQTFMKSLRTE